MGIPKGCYDVIAWHLILSIILTSVLSEEEVGIAVSSSAHGGGSLMQGLIYHGNVKNKQLLKEKPWKALGDLSASEAQFNEDTVCSIRGSIWVGIFSCTRKIYHK